MATPKPVKNIPVVKGPDAMKSSSKPKAGHGFGMKPHDAMKKRGTGKPRVGG